MTYKTITKKEKRNKKHNFFTLFIMIISINIWLSHVIGISTNNNYYLAINNFPAIKIILGILPLLTYTIIKVVNIINIMRKPR